MAQDSNTSLWNLAQNATGSIRTATTTCTTSTTTTSATITSTITTSTTGRDHREHNDRDGMHRSQLESSCSFIGFELDSRPARFISDLKQILMKNKLRGKEVRKKSLGRLNGVIRKGECGISPLSVSGNVESESLHSLPKVLIKGKQLDYSVKKKDNLVNIEKISLHDKSCSEMEDVCFIGLGGDCQQDNDDGTAQNIIVIKEIVQGDSPLAVTGVQQNSDLVQPSKQRKREAELVPPYHCRGPKDTSPLVVKVKTESFSLEHQMEVEEESQYHLFGAPEIIEEVVALEDLVDEPEIPPVSSTFSSPMSSVNLDHSYSSPCLQETLTTSLEEGNLGIEFESLTGEILCDMDFASPQSDTVTDHCEAESNVLTCNGDGNVTDGLSSAAAHTGVPYCSEMTTNLHLPNGDRRDGMCSAGPTSNNTVHHSVSPAELHLNGNDDITQHLPGSDGGDEISPAELHLSGDDEIILHLLNGDKRDGMSSAELHISDGITLHLLNGDERDETSPAELHLSGDDVTTLHLPNSDKRDGMSSVGTTSNTTVHHPVSPAKLHLSGDDGSDVLGSTGTDSSDLPQPLITTDNIPCEQSEENFSYIPTSQPEEKSTKRPTPQPEEKFTKHPASQQEEKSTKHPTSQPEEKPTKHPTSQQEEKPTKHPTPQPEEKFMKHPTSQQEEKPIKHPTQQPEEKPTKHPTPQPEEKYTKHPTLQPEEKFIKHLTPQSEEISTKHPTLQSEEKSAKQSVEDLKLDSFENAFYNGNFQDSKVEEINVQNGESEECMQRPESDNSTSQRAGSQERMMIRSSIQLRKRKIYKLIQVPQRESINYDVISDIDSYYTRDVASLEDDLPASREKKEMEKLPELFPSPKAEKRAVSKIWQVLVSQLEDCVRGINTLPPAVTINSKKRKRSLSRGKKRGSGSVTLKKNDSHNVNISSPVETQDPRTSQSVKLKEESGQAQTCNENRVALHKRKCVCFCWYNTVLPVASRRTCCGRKRVKSGCRRSSRTVKRDDVVFPTDQRTFFSSLGLMEKSLYDKDKYYKSLVTHRTRQVRANQIKGKDHYRMFLDNLHADYLDQSSEKLKQPLPLTFISKQNLCKLSTRSKAISKGSNLQWLARKRTDDHNFEGFGDADSKKFYSTSILALRQKYEFEPPIDLKDIGSSVDDSETLPSMPFCCTDTNDNFTENYSLPKPRDSQLELDETTVDMEECPVCEKSSDEICSLEHNIDMELLSDRNLESRKCKILPEKDDCSLVMEKEALHPSQTEDRDVSCANKMDDEDCHSDTLLDPWSVCEEKFSTADSDCIMEGIDEETSAQSSKHEHSISKFHVMEVEEGGNNESCDSSLPDLWKIRAEKVLSNCSAETSAQSSKHEHSISKSHVMEVEEGGNSESCGSSLPDLWKIRAEKVLSNCSAETSAQSSKHEHSVSNVSKSHVMKVEEDSDSESCGSSLPDLWKIRAEKVPNNCSGETSAQSSKHEHSISNVMEVEEGSNSESCGSSLLDLWKIRTGKVASNCSAPSMAAESSDIDGRSVGSLVMQEQLIDSATLFDDSSEDCDFLGFDGDPNCIKSDVKSPPHAGEENAATAPDFHGSDRFDESNLKSLEYQRQMMAPLTKQHSSMDASKKVEDLSCYAATPKVPVVEGSASDYPKSCKVQVAKIASRTTMEHAMKSEAGTLLSSSTSKTETLEASASPILRSPQKNEKMATKLPDIDLTRNCRVNLTKLQIPDSALERIKIGREGSIVSPLFFGKLSPDKLMETGKKTSSEKSFASSRYFIRTNVKRIKYSELLKTNIRRSLNDMHEKEKPLPAYSAKHVRSVSDGILLKCNICLLTFTTKGALTTHIQTHEEKEFTCAECGLSFPQELQLQSHTRLHTTARQAVLCEKCGESFSQLDDLRNHVKNHLSPISLKCTMCNQSCEGQAAVSEPLDPQLKDCKNRCVECGGSVVVTTSPRRHTRTHVRGKLHHCALCKVDSPTHSN